MQLLHMFASDLRVWNAELDKVCFFFTGDDIL